MYKEKTLTEKIYQFTELTKKVKGLDIEELKTSKDYENLLNLESDLKNIVLTGDELLEGLHKLADDYLDIMNQLDNLKENAKEIKTLRENYEELKELMFEYEEREKEIIKLRRIEHKNIVRDYKEIKKRLNEKDKELKKYQNKLSSISFLLAGKKGTLIDDITKIIVD